MLLGALCSSAEVHIQETGLKGYMRSYGPERLAIEISNPAAQAQTFLLRLTEANGHTTFFHADYKLQLNGRETRQLELPALLGQGQKLRAEQINAGGLVISSDEKDITFDQSELIAVLCSNTSTCKAVSDSIRSGATVEEQNEKEQQLKIVLLLEAPQTWFAYSPARSVVVAGPVEQPAARDAIANYARFGGDLIVAADEAPHFLTQYRTAGVAKVPIGNGTVRFVGAASGPEMKEIFTPEKPRKRNLWENMVITFRATVGSNALLQWTGTEFVFPKLRWVIGWMVIYTLIIGVVNFFVLRRVGRVEIGWITVPVIAACFALLFYFISVRGKMTRFALDEASVCWMDSKSTVGVAEHRFRVASPEVRDVVLQVPTWSVMAASAHDPLFRASDAATIWDDEKQRHPSRNVPDIVMDSAQHVPLGMLRLSFRDIEFRTVHTFPGTVRLENGVLMNGTGQSFSQALVVDFGSRQFYDLGALRDGGEAHPFSQAAQKLRTDPGADFRFKSSDHLQNAFSLAGFLNSQSFVSKFSEKPLTFIGFTDKPLVQGELEGITPERKTYTLYVVTLEGQK